MTVLDAVVRVMKHSRTDGLRNAAAGCSCRLPEISPDGCMSEECTLGYRRDCPACGHWYIASSVSRRGEPCPECGYEEPRVDARLGRFLCRITALAQRDTPSARAPGPEARWDGSCVEDDYSEDSWPDELGPHAWPVLSREQMLNAHEEFQTGACQPESAAAAEQAVTEGGQ